VFEFIIIFISLNQAAASGIGMLAAGEQGNSAEGSVEIIWNTLVGIWHDFLGSIPMLVGAIVVIVLTIAVVKIFNRFAQRSLSRFNLKESQETLVTRLGVIVIWVLGILIALMLVFPDLTPGKALAGLGLGSIAVGFAFKDIFENFFAGILILWRFPFENGDFIKCEDIEGSVENVTIRNTLIRRTSGELVVVPNATIFKSSVHVLTDQKLRRTTVIAGVAYGEDVYESRQVIQKAVQGCKTVSDEKEIEIFAHEFADSSINFEVTWWTNPAPLDIRKSKDEVVEAVKKALDDAGIEIPFPYRTLTFKKPLEIDSTNRNTDIQVSE
jgi:small-conductance mechanosensitive channel